MKTRDLIGLGAKHVRNALSEELYLRTGRDVTRPVSIFAEVIERCNYKCRYCDYWRRPNYRDEMSIEEWKGALASLKEFIGSYHIEFAGGEPYLKKGFIDLLEFCKEQDLHWGVTTNGGAYLNRKIVEKTVKARPFNIEEEPFSIDTNKHGSAPAFAEMATLTQGAHAALHRCPGTETFRYRLVRLNIGSPRSGEAAVANLTFDVDRSARTGNVGHRI